MATAKPRYRRNIGAGLLVWSSLCVLIIPCASAFAQASRPAGDSEATASLIPYSDPTFGFQMRVPAGWSYDRGRFEGPEGAIGLFRGRDAGGMQALQVLIYRSFETSDFSAWLAGFVDRLGEAYGGKKIPEQRWSEQSRERAVLLVDTKVGATRTQTYYLCIPFDPHTVWVLVFASVVSSPDVEQQLRTRFDDIAASVEVLYNPILADRLTVAFEHGLTLLKDWHAKTTVMKIDETERFFDIAIGGKSIGYLSRLARREQRTIAGSRRPGTPGLRVHEESWRFADDGTVRHTDLNLFSSFDRRHELIENRMTQIPAPDVAAQQLYIELDQCIRTDNTLVSSFSTSLDTVLPEPRPPIPIGSRYLDLAWVHMLPRLLTAARDETYAFAIYDSATRALIVYTIQPMGPCQIPGSAGLSGYKFETREGFVSQPSCLYCDKDGEIVRIESGDLVIMRTSRDEIERKYAGRREPARRRLQPANSQLEQP